MKQSKRVFSVLLALVMLLSAIPMSVYAAYSPYTSADHYDSLDDPVVTPEQAASMACDMIDKMLKEKNMTIPVEFNYYVGTLSKTIDLTSIDQATTSIDDFWNWGWVDAAFFVLDFADIEDMNMSAIEDCPLRTDSGKTDLDVLLYLFRFLTDNSERIGKIIDDTFDYGFAEKYVPDDVHNIVATLKSSVLKSLNDDVDPPAGTTVDSLVQTMVDKTVVGTLNTDTGKYEDGLLPSMAGKTNINTTSVYTFITDAINAGLGDIVVPMLSKMLLGMAGVTFSDEFPGGDASHMDTTISSVIDMVTGLGGEVPYTPEDLLTPLSKMTAALKFLLLGGGLSNYFYLDNTGLHISDLLIETVDTLVRQALTMLPGFGIFAPDTVFKTADEIKAMSTPACYAYLARLLLNQYVEFADIPASATTVRSVLTYLLIGLAKDVLPEMDFDAMISTGTLNPNTDGVFVVGVPLMRYYLNGLFPIDIPEGLNFEQTLDCIVTWFLDVKNFGGLFNLSSISASDTVWQKIDKILFNYVPGGTGIIPINWLPAEFTGSKYLVMDWLLGNVLDFNYVGLLSIVKRNSASELNTNFVQVIMNTVSRFLKGTFGGHEIFAINKITTLDEIFTKTNLRSIVQPICQYISDYGNDLLDTLLPLMTKVLGIWSKETYIRKASEGATLVGITGLQALLDSYTPANLNENIQYYQTGYHFFGPEDYAELRNYDNYKQAKDEAQGLLDAYKSDPETLDLQKNTDVAYRITYYYNQLVKRSSACATQLTKEIEKAYYAGYDSTKYSPASWTAYQTAYNFALNVRSDAILHPTTVQQSKITMARHMLFKAVHSLTTFAGYADYTKIDFYIQQAEQKLATVDQSLFKPESIQNLVSALNVAKNLDRNITKENNSIVNEAAENLNNAMYSLVYILDPGIVPVTGSAKDIYGNAITPVIKEERKYIYGLSIGGLIGKVFETTGGAISKITKTSFGYGTGTRVSLTFNGAPIATYTAIVFGDVNGDGNIDDADAGILIDRIIFDKTLSSDKIFAGDINQDGNADAIDADKISDSLNYKVVINQLTGEGITAIN